jgi:hypothetical protein
LLFLLAVFYVLLLKGKLLSSAQKNLWMLTEGFYLSHDIVTF